MEATRDDNGKVLAKCKHSPLIVEMEFKEGSLISGTVIVGDNNRFSEGYKSKYWNLFEFSRLKKQ